MLTFCAERNYILSFLKQLKLENYKEKLIVLIMHLPEIEPGSQEWLISHDTNTPATRMCAVVV